MKNFETVDEKRRTEKRHFPILRVTVKIDEHAALNIITTMISLSAIIIAFLKLL